MDLIDTLAGQLGVDPSQARAVAGAVLGQVQQQTEAADDIDSNAISDAVPELGEWKQAATDALEGDTSIDDLLGNLTGGEGGLGGMLGGLAKAAGSGLGNDLVEQMAGKDAAQQAQVVALLSNLGLSTEQAAMVVPTVLGFLKERLGEGTLEQILKVAPFLSGGGGASAGGMAGALGGLFS